MHRPARRALLAVLAGLLVLLVAPPLAQAETTVEVRITSRLEPANVTVVPGTTVTWVNADGDRHRMRSEGPDEFDSGNLEPGERFSHTFRSAGTTSYVDDRDEDDAAYHGTVVVIAEAPSGSAPAPSGTSGTPGTAGTSGTPGTGDQAGPTGPQTVAVSMADRRFSPATLEITTGDTVRFVNDDDREHTATAADRGFDSGILQVGQEFERTFTRAGTYSYLCLLHPDMTGTIAVADAGGTAPPPTAASGPAPTSTTPPSPPPPRTSAPRPTGGGTPSVQRVTVQMRDFSFAPATVEVTAGSTVVFDNTGRAPHTATATDGSFDSDLVSPGGSFERRFDEIGSFAYTCLLHPEMTGEVVVTAAPGRRASSAGPSPDRATVLDGSATDATGDDPAASPDGGPTDPSGPAVSVVDDAFLPEVLEVGTGQEVVWTNDGDAVHTVTAEDGSFDSGLMAAGDSFRMRFEEPATIAYRCSVHPGMTAEVRVLALADGAATLDAAAAGADGAGGLSLMTLEVLMLGAFAVALAGFTVLSRRLGAMDAGADA